MHSKSILSMAKRKQSLEFRAHMAELMRSRSAEISRLTGERMTAPEVRQRIRAGLETANGEATEVQVLWLAWKAARPSARARFLTEVTKADGNRRQ